jgi:transposase
VDDETRPVSAAVRPTVQLLTAPSGFTPGQGDSYLRGYCTQAATGAATTDTFLGERLRRLSRRLGGARARCAVGRSVLVIIWHLLADPEARYTELGSDWHARKTDTDRRTRSLLNQLRALHPDSDITITAA